MVIRWLKKAGAHVEVGNRPWPGWISPNTRSPGRHYGVTLHWNRCRLGTQTYLRVKLSLMQKLAWNCHNRLVGHSHWNIWKTQCFICFSRCSFDCWQIIKLWKPRFWAMKSRYFFSFLEDFKSRPCWPPQRGFAEKPLGQDIKASMFFTSHTT